MIPRYTRPEIGQVWSDENKFECWRQVEIAAMRAWSAVGKVPESAVKEVEANTCVDVSRIQEIESEVRHDVIAFTTSLAEQIDADASRFIHYGLTSSDVLDTALALQLKQAGEMLIDDVQDLVRVIGEQAKRHRKTPMIGRTHGVHAEPVTLGLKLAIWYEELDRARVRLEDAVREVSFGKISGATGTYAQVPPHVEDMVCEELGLSRAPISSQILGRDRHAAFLTQISLIGALLEKYATEIRHLQRTEVRELEEPFSSGQKGSSAMPHKRNPIVTERITGLARLLRSNAQVAVENIALWHERDISHSSVERVILPDSTILLHYMLVRFTMVMDDLEVYPERMMQNLHMTGGLIFSQKVLLALVAAGMSRENAYEVVQDCAMRSWRESESFAALIRDDERATAYLSPEKLQECFALGSHLQHVDQVFERLGLI